MSADPKLDRWPVYSVEWGEQFIGTLRNYMNMLDDSLDDPLDAPDVATFTGQPYCGCSDCWEREAYFLATKLAIEGYIAGEVTLEGPLQGPQLEKPPLEPQ